jgi:hypothetical protein
MWQAVHPDAQVVIHRLVCRRTEKELDLEAEVHECLEHNDAVNAECYGTTIINCD